MLAKGPSLILSFSLLTVFSSVANGYVDVGHWWGAGTYWNTVTDPTDPTTQWDQGINWVEGQHPWNLGTAHLPLTNTGYVNANDGGSIRDLFVDGTTTEGAFHVGPNVSFRVREQMYLGDEQIGRAVNSGGVLTVEHELLIGNKSQSSGTFVQSNGELTVDRWFYIAHDADSSGTFVLEGGTVTRTSSGYAEIIGRKGTGNFIQSGGTHRLNNLVLGYIANHEGTSQGTYRLSGGDLISLDQTECIGATGHGMFIQTGGKNTAWGTITLGRDWNLDQNNNVHRGNGEYDFSAGELYVHQNLYIGSYGTGTFTQSGGISTINAHIYLGHKTGSVGTYTISDGVLDVNGTITVADSGVGIFNLQGGTVCNASDGIGHFLGLG